MRIRLLAEPGSRRGNRALWRRLHRWLGLTLGLPMVVFGLTGSVLVFWPEIDAALNPGLFEVVESRDPLPLQTSIDAAVRAAPLGWEGLWLPLPADRRGALPFHFYYPEPRASEVDAESLNVFVDPGTGRVIGTRVFYHPWNPLKHSFVGFFFKLHYAFFLGATGVIIVGLIGALLLVSTASGMIIWWPKGRGWRRALSIKRKASSARLAYDLHQTAAVYPLLLLLGLLVSGVSFNLPDEFRWVVRRFSALSEDIASAAPPRDLDLDAALAEARRRHRGGRLESLTVSRGSTRTITACYADVPELARYVQDTRCLVLDAGDGALLRVQDGSRGTGGDVFMAWQWPLHSGQAFGWTGRILVFLTGLACVLLPVTGAIRWLQKRRARSIVGMRTRSAG